MGILDDFAPETPTEYYPGSKKPLIRHPNRTENTPKFFDNSGWDAKPLKVKIGGVEHEMFTLGNLAQALGRKSVTLRKWEADRVIPKATFLKKGREGDPRGNRRLYSRPQVEGILRIAIEERLMEGDNRSISATTFTSKVFDLFRSLS